MRITQQNMTQNIISVNKSSTIPADVKALIGKVLTGQITGIQSNQMATLVSGENKLTVDIAGLKLQENQIVNLKIVDYKDGALITKLVNNLPISEQTSSLTEMLSKLGVSDQTDNRNIVEAMRSANIPLTKDNFKMMRTGMIEVKALISELSGGSEIPLDSELETPIKALAIKIIQQSGSTPQNISNAGNSISANTIVTNSALANTNTNANANTPNNTVTNAGPVLDNRTAIASDMGGSMITEDGAELPGAVLNTTNAENSKLQEGVTPSGLKNSGTNDLELIFKTIQASFGNEGNTLKQAVQSLLNQFDYKQESVILKNDLPMTLKNIFLAYDALSDEGGITNRFNDILKNMDKLAFSKESILSIVANLTSEATQSEKLEAIIESIRKEIPESEVKQNLERELVVIKESTTMNKALNDQMMFMQMPIPINEQIQNVDIYYKKNKKKTDPDDLTLLIALKTFNLGEVRCVVHKLNQNFTLNFSLQDEEIKTYFEGYGEKLTEALKNYPERQFAINYTVKSDQVDFVDNTNSEYDDLESFGFDLKV